MESLVSQSHRTEPGGRLQAAATAVAPSAAEVALRAELGGLKTGGLRKRARAEGVTNDELDDADDLDGDPRVALVELILARAAASGREAAAAAAPAAEGNAAWLSPENRIVGLGGAV